MKKIRLIIALLVAFAAGTFISAQVRDYRDLNNAHQQVVEVIHMMERARAANHYDMRGHAEKAEQFLRDAEHEISLAVQDADR